MAYQIVTTQGGVTGMVKGSPASPTHDPRALPDGAQETFWHAPDGHAIRRLDVPLPPGTPARGHLLFVPGRGDVYEKYVETLGFWRDIGFETCAIDWRGQGGSGRIGRDATIGHVDDFTLWLGDLQAFWQDWQATRPGPKILVGHSMGGHLALRSLTDRLVNPDLAILCAPMMGFHAPGIPFWAQRALARAMVALGDPRRPAWRDGEKPASRLVKRMDLLTHDGERYAAEMWWRRRRPYLEMGPASWGWMAAAIASYAHLATPGLLESMTTPTLIFTTSADRLVSHRAILAAARRLPNGELVQFGREARHEILREVDPVRNRALAAMQSFFDRHLGALPQTQA
jgi:lysophospholipase